MTTRRSALDVVREYWPMIAALTALVSGYATMQQRAMAQEQRVDALEVRADSAQESSRSIGERLSRIEGKLDIIVDRQK